MTSKSPQDCFEKLVRLEFAQAHPTDEGAADVPSEPAGVPSPAWLKGQPEEVRKKYVAELERISIIGAADDPQASALELAWIYAQSIKAN